MAFKSEKNQRLYIANGMKAKMGRFGFVRNWDLNIPSERPIKELQNARFSFEIGHSKLKLWVLTVS